MKKKLQWILLGIILLFASVFFIRMLTLFSELSHIENTDSLGRGNFETTYAFIVEDATDEFWRQTYEAARAAGEEHGVYVEMFGENLQNDYTMEDLFEMAIAANVSGIMVHPEGDQCMELVKKATEQGIPVITMVDDCNSNEQICFVGTSSYNLGRVYGEQLLALEGDKEKRVSILVADGENESRKKLIISGIRNAVAGHRFLIETERVQTDSAFRAEEIIERLILDKENRTDVFICLTSDETTYATQLIVEYNQVGRIEIIGTFDSEAAREAIQKKIVHSVVAINSVQLGQQAVRNMIQYQEGDHISSMVDVDIYVFGQSEASQTQSGREDDES